MHLLFEVLNYIAIKPDGDADFVWVGLYYRTTFSFAESSLIGLFLDSTAGLHFYLLFSPK